MDIMFMNFTYVLLVDYEVPIFSYEELYTYREKVESFGAVISKPRLNCNQGSTGSAIQFIGLRL